MSMDYSSYGDNGVTVWVIGPLNLLLTPSDLPSREVLSMSQDLGAS